MFKENICPTCKRELQPDQITLSVRLKFLRSQRGLTQTQLANELGKYQTWIAKVESRVEIKNKTAVLLANYYGVSLDYLLTGKK